jgi:large subunit ribosomal protein L21
MVVRREKKKPEKEKTGQHRRGANVAKASQDVAEKRVWAVIPLGGTQRRVCEGDVLVVNRLAEKPGQKFKVTQVYLLFDGKGMKIGQPEVAGVKVELEVLEERRGEKIDIFKYKAKSRYRKRRGHRQALSKVKVLKIGWKENH